MIDPPGMHTMFLGKSQNLLRFNSPHDRIGFERKSRTHFPLRSQENRVFGQGWQESAIQEGGKCCNINSAGARSDNTGRL